MIDNSNEIKMTRREQTLRFNSILGLTAFVMVLGVLASCGGDDKDGEKAVPAPMAAFSAGETAIFKGGEVSFTDESTGGATSWLWTFEGGTPTTSVEQNPTIKYETAGTFDVTLIAGNDGGASEPVKKADLVNVTEIPTKEVTIEVTADSWRRNDFRITDTNGANEYVPFANYVDPTQPDIAGVWVRDAMLKFDLSSIDVSKVMKAELFLYTSKQTSNFLVNNQKLSAYHWSFDEWTDVDTLDIPHVTGAMVDSVELGTVGTVPLGTADYSATINDAWGNEVSMDITDGVKAETDGTLSMNLKFDTETTAEKLVGRVMLKEATYLDEAGNQVAGQGPKLVLVVQDN